VNPSPALRRFRRPGVVALLAVGMTAATVLLASCGGTDKLSYAEAHPAARAVETVLELREADVRDVDAYAPYFESSEVATALAEASDVPTGTPRVPGWQTPYVSGETSTTADVVVVWRDTAEFPDWPAVNVFSTRLLEGRWVIVDAVETSSAPEPAEPRE